MLQSMPLSLASIHHLQLDPHLHQVDLFLSFSFRGLVRGQALASVATVLATRAQPVFCVPATHGRCQPHTVGASLSP